MHVHEIALGRRSAVRRCWRSPIRVASGSRSSARTWAAFSIPTPVSPYFQDAQEQRFWVHEKYKKAPILGPIAPGQPCVAVDTPSDDEVMQVARNGSARSAVAFRCSGNAAEQRADRQRQDRRLHRSAARVSAGRPGSATSRSLQMHGLLHRSHPRRLAAAIHDRAPTTPRKWSTSTITTCTWSATSTPG